MWGDNNMGVYIGDHTQIKGVVNIGENAKQVAKDFNIEFNSLDKILDLLKLDLENHYTESDKEEILQTYDEFKNEIHKPKDERNNAIVKSKLSILNKAFSFIANVSSIAGLVLTLTQVLH